SPLLDLHVVGDADGDWEDPEWRWAGRALLGGLLVAGTDLRAHLPPLHAVDDLDVLTAIARSIRFARRHLRGGQKLRLPVGPPDPDDEFLGYATISKPAGYPPGTTAGTRELVTAVFKIA